MEEPVLERTSKDYLEFKINDLELSINKLQNNLNFKKKLLKLYNNKAKKIK